MYDNLAKRFPQIKFEESDPVLDHAGDIDYLGWVGSKAFGLQIKPITTRANFGNYSASERMQNTTFNKLIIKKNRRCYALLLLHPTRFHSIFNQIKTVETSQYIHWFSGSKH